MNASPILIGAVLGAALVALAEWRGRERAAVVYGVGLVVAAIIYVGFALVGGASDWIETEIGGALVFSAVVVLGVRRFPSLLAAGWALHVGWDVFLHIDTGADFVPGWYPQLCVGFDLVLAGAIFALALPFARRQEA